MDNEARGEVTAPVADERFLADPHAHLENSSRTVGSAS